MFDQYYTGNPTFGYLDFIDFPLFNIYHFAALDNHPLLKSHGVHGSNPTPIRFQSGVSAPSKLLTAY